MAEAGSETAYSRNPVGPLNRFELEMVIVGRLVWDADGAPDAPDAWTADARLLLERDLVGTFEDEGRREMYASLAAFFRSKGRIATVSESAELALASSQTRQDASALRGRLLECHTLARLRKDIGIDVLLARLEKAAVPAIRRLPAPVSDDELIARYEKTPFGFLDSQIRIDAPNVSPLLTIASACILQSMLVAPCLRINGRKANAAAMLCAAQGFGKTSCSNAVLRTLSALGLGAEVIDEGSDKAFILQLKHKPWGLLKVGEFSSMASRQSWESGTINKINEAFDADSISLSSVNSGSCRVENQAPSMLFEMQPQAFLDTMSGNLTRNGFFRRLLVALDRRRLPELMTLDESQEPRNTVDGMAVAENWKRFYDGVWLPRRVMPGEEETIEVGEEGGKSVLRKTGYVCHPIPPKNLITEQYMSVFADHHFPSEHLPFIRALRYKYLPLLALPLTPKEALANSVIPASALRMAEPVVIGFYWALVEMLGGIPEDRKEALIMRIVAFVQRRPGVKHRDLLSGVKHSDSKVMADAIQVARDTGRIRAQVNENKNKTKTITFFSTDAVPEPLIVVGPKPHAPRAQPAPPQQPPEPPAVAVSVPKVEHPDEHDLMNGFSDTALAETPIEIDALPVGYPPLEI